MLVIGEKIELLIEKLGLDGDGISYYDQHKIIVPGALAGESVIAEITAKEHKVYFAKINEIITASSFRTSPPCPYFHQCGGCKLQHMHEDAYYNFKQNIARDVIEKLRAPQVVIKPTVKIGAYNRRRAQLKISAHKGVPTIGYHAHKSHQVIDITNCLLLEAELNNFINAFRTFLAQIKEFNKLSSVNLTTTDNGLEVALFATKALSKQFKEALYSFAKERQLARLTFSHDDFHEVIFNGKAVVNFAGIEVELPAHTFLQASNKTIESINELISQSLKDYSKIVDLYSGCGTYSFPLTKLGKSVASYEGSYDMIEAMNNSIKKYKLEHLITAHTRDLKKNPVKENLLNNFDAAIINPPRAGAESQVRQIASSKIKKVIMVSCNPKTFVIDAKILIDAGFEMTSLTPIDQFYFSSHLELFAEFVRKL